MSFEKKSLEVVDSETGKNKSIGSFLLDTGKITPADAERILRLQKEKNLRFGEAAKALGLVSEADIQGILAQQFDFPIFTGEKSEFNPELIAASQPFTQQVDVLRAIRSQLMLRWFDEQHKTLALISPNPGDGRSYLTANLGIVFSQLGERTLIIDADMRVPKQHKLFKLNQNQGLSDLLAGRIDEKSAITRIPHLKDLSILPTGTIPPNPQELIGRGFSQTLKRLVDQYDIILIDTSASNFVTDYQLIATKAGAAMLIARQHKSRLADLQNLKQHLEEHNVKCVGSIVNVF
jgi:protein-tyrosine kinase